jgi:hypothetical protein
MSAPDGVDDAQRFADGWFHRRITELEAKLEKALSDLAWNVSKRAELEAEVSRLRSTWTPPRDDAAPGWMTRGEFGPEP